VCTSVTTCAQDLTNTAGNGLLVYVQWQTDTPPPTVTDTQGNAYELAVAQSGNWSNALLYAQNVKGGANTVTASFTANQTIELWVHEYANLGSLDSTAHAVGTTATMLLGPLAASQPGELLWAGFMDGKMQTATAGFTTRSTFDSNLTEDTVAAAAGSTTIAATQLAAQLWVAVAASFKPASSGPVLPPVPVAVTLSPVSATVVPGGTQQFTATVTGSTNTAVTWSATAGSVSTGGLYTAPSTGGAYTVTATSTADSTKSASAMVIVIAPVQHTVTLSWRASASAVSGYSVYRGAISHGPYTQINTVLNAPTNYVDNTVESGQTYYYVVTSVESGVESVYSNEVVATIPTP